MLACCALLFVSCNKDKNKTTPTNQGNTGHTHSWSAATCTDPKRCSTCGTTEGSPTGHTPMDVPATEANCTEDGMSAGVRCSVCATWITRPEVVTPALGHIDENPVDKLCDRCGETTCDHTFDYTDWEYGNNTHWYKATCGCDVKGSEAKHQYDAEGITCKVCGYDTEIDGHQHELDSFYTVDPTDHWYEAACGHEDQMSLKEAHYDEDDDDKCDACGATMLIPYNFEAKYSTYNWGTTDIVVCLNEDSNNQELSSELRRYLAGDTKNVQKTDDIDYYVSQRNARALQMTKVNPIYTYWGENDNDYANSHWGQTITRMVETVLANAPGSPDVFVNQMYDMVSASLQKAFANIRTTKLSGGDNNFSFMEKEFQAYSKEFGEEFGYMMEYMSELGFSLNKQYLIASDYFIDLVRAFFVVPMNLNLLNEIDVSLSSGDRDGNGIFNTDDFYAMVTKGEWTYDMMAQYSAAIYSNDSTITGGSMDDTNGFVLIINGLPSSGIFYTSSVQVFEREYNEATGYYDCYYPNTNEDLYNFCDALSELVSSVGVYVPPRATVSHLGVRTAFTSDKLLFGGIILLGSLEYQEYQDMKSSGGFGVLPVPVYQAGDSYRTLIHNMGRIAAISANTKVFAQCSAFLDYQSTHSTEILDEYYRYKLQYEVADASEGNIEILRYIRKNVRSGFDKAYEDAIGYYFSGLGTYGDSWLGFIEDNNYKAASIRDFYITNKASREKALEDIVKAYPGLPE